VGGERSRAPARSSRTLIADEENELFFSAASLWEIVIKSGLGRDDFQVDVHLLRRGLADNGFAELAVTSTHAIAISALPPLHKDPFDRMLVAQATAEGIELLTCDDAVAAYPGPIRKL
jgi:PIN domain nuclease of toxin-antitoxin system